MGLFAVGNRLKIVVAVSGEILMQPIQFSSGQLVYGALIICGFLTDILLVSFFGHYAHTSLIAVMLSSALFILGICGLMRPHRVTLDAQSLTLRPTFGRQQRWTRHQIVNVEEIVSPPFAALIARVKDDGGKHRAITLSNRIAPAGLGVRHEGREVGIMPSSRLSLVQAWLKDAL